MASSANRPVTINMKSHSGTINRFYAFVDGKRVIAADGNTAPTYTGTVSTSPVLLKVRVWGTDTSRYTLEIDLPDTAHDQSHTLSLAEGYHELDLVL